LLVSSIAHLITTAIFERWGGLADWTYLTGTVGLVTVAVHLVIWAVTPHNAAEVVQTDVFMRRLPIAMRGPLVRIEAQDHYLNVVTQKGSELILMRLSDAMDELSGQGMQVHRSHWITTASVTQHRREGGRDLLVMSDGACIPVSRSFRDAARVAGLF
jgi:DNA-binding LytR/AlgR family response regulator